MVNVYFASVNICGDQITIGHHTLRFIEQQAEEAEQDEFEKTMVISPAARGQSEIHRQAEEAAQAATAMREYEHTRHGAALSRLITHLSAMQVARARVHACVYQCV